MHLRTVIFFLAICIAGSCNTAPPPPEETPEDGGTYFSIKQFAQDQWNTYHGQPFGIVKKVHMNGRTDSTMLNSYTADWGAILKIFFDTDISDPKFLGQYNFTMFEDATTSTVNFWYEAKDPNLYTRKLQISADKFNHKVKSIFIEALENRRGYSKTRKLFYIPVKVISIQEYENVTPGPEKELLIEYRFL